MKPSPQNATVLVIDDDKGNRQLFATQLQLENYHVLLAPNGPEGILLAQTHNPDIILLDIMMPRMNGFIVCEKLKSDPKTKLIPIIIITALDRAHRLKGIRAGADEFLSRPFNREEFSVRVRNLIRLRQTLVNLEEERNHLRLLYDIGQTINSQLNLDVLMYQIIDQTLKAVGATKGNIILLNVDRQIEHRFKIDTVSEESTSHLKIDIIEPTQGFIGRLLVRNKPEIIDDISNDPRWVLIPSDLDRSGSALGVPLTRKNQVIGVMILNHSDSEYFNSQHFSLVETIATQVSAALENAFLFDEEAKGKQKLKTLLEQSSDAIIVVDENLSVSIFNQMAETLFNIQFKEVYGKHIHAIPELHVLKSDTKDTCCYPLKAGEIHLANGQVLLAKISTIPEIGYLLAMRDITELKRIETMKVEQERQEKEALKTTFSRYMSPQLIKHLLESNADLSTLRERRHAIVMYADLRNSTAGMIKRAGPDTAVKQLNEFFTHMTEIAMNNQGIVFDLTGDEILVAFNALVDQPLAANLVIKTAVAMQIRFAELQEKWRSEFGTDVGLGIGIDKGDVLVGNVGAKSLMSFRMVGEVMSKAHRLVDLANDGQIIVTTDIYDALSSSIKQELSKIEFSKLGPVLLKGFSTPQSLYLLQTRE